MNKKIIFLYLQKIELNQYNYEKDNLSSIICLTLFGRKRIGLVYINNNLDKLKKQATNAEL